MPVQDDAAIDPARKGRWGRQRAARGRVWEGTGGGVGCRQCQPTIPGVKYALVPGWE